MNSSHSTKCKSKVYVAGLDPVSDKPPHPKKKFYNRLNTVSEEAAVSGRRSGGSEMLDGTSVAQFEEADVCF